MLVRPHRRRPVPSRRVHLSRGNSGFCDAANGSYVDLSADYTSGYYRVTFRPGPYNMFTSAAAMRQAIAAHGADTPQQIPSWGFLAATDHTPTIAGMAGGVAATELTIPYREDISLVKYQYDPQTRT